MTGFERRPAAEALKKALARWFGSAAPAEVERAELSFYVNFLREGMTVFDVGANVGEMSLLFSRLVGESGSVHSFEANPSTFEKMREICRLSGRTNITPVPKAVSDKPGQVSLKVYGDKYASWSTLADRPLANYGIDVRPEGVRKVDSVSLDDYCAEKNILKVDLLKIDVEGAELQVLQGARRLLMEKKIGRCLFEFGRTTFDMGNRPGQIYSLLEGSGYRVRNAVAGDRLFPAGGNPEKAHFSMYVARPS